MAFELKRDKLAPQQLSEARQAFEQAFARSVAGLVWRDRTFVRLDGQNGIHFDFASHTVDAGLRNFMRFASRFGRVLRFNVNATKAEFPVVENALPSGIQSINPGRKVSVR
jgi:hypothetical protein